MPETSVFDEVRSSAVNTPNVPEQTDDSSDDSVFNEVRKSVKAGAPSTSTPPVNWTLGGTIKGIGGAGLSLVGGTLGGISHAVNDLMPEAIGGPGSRAATEQTIKSDPLFNYQPSTPEGKAILGGISTAFSPISMAAHTAHDVLSRSFGPRTADVAGDIATLAATRGMLGGEAEAAAPIEQGHPLTAQAEAEVGRLSDMTARARDAGLDLPSGGTAERHAQAAVNNRPLVNDIVRNDMKLPKNAPLTPDMLDAGRTAYVSPAYKAISSIDEPIPIGHTIKDLESGRGKFNPDLPAPAGQITGAEAVRFSQDARFEARSLDRQAAMGNPAAAAQARLYRQAAGTVEDAVESHLKATGREQLATDWDNARVYAAKSHSYEDALDGAGNVRVTDLKSQLVKKGKPMTGDQEMLATLGAQYPEAFRITRTTMPQAGPLRKAVAGALPIVGGVVGAYTGGETGAGLGTAAGEYGKSRVLNR